jgi:nucleotide-binding universal stress UspA family protein
MATTYVAAYDGSAAGRRAVDFALRQAGHSGAALVIVHVLEWSPYSFLTKQEIEERHVRRNEELARARNAILEPLAAELGSSGVEIKTEARFGHSAESICAVAEERGASQIFVGRSGTSTALSRIFGSTAATMAQMAPVPCTIVP